MKSFVYQTAPSRVVFGAGSLQQLPAEAERLGLRRVLLLCTPRQQALAARARDLLDARVVATFDQAAMHVPAALARAATTVAQELRADGLLALGGGSATGLGKAVALHTGLPLLAVPTTYAGSEMTPIWGLTEDGLKRTGRDARVLPRCVIYDPLLSLHLPLATSISSAFNAIAHGAEGLYAHDGNPITALMAEEGIRALAQAMPRLAAAPTDPDARARALYGAWLCGSVLGAVSMGLHHKLCHTLGGSFDLPHAEVHTVVLPHALAYNAGHAPEAMAALARALGAGSAAQAPAALQALARAHAAPLSLRALGMPADGLDRAADLAVTTPYPNPRPLQRGALRALLQSAYDGAVPATPEPDPPPHLQ